MFELLDAQHCLCHTAAEHEHKDTREEITLITTETPDALGVDIGGVIIDRVNDATDTSFFGDRFLETTETEGVIDALRRLQDERFRGRVFLISKCGTRVRERTLAWLAHHRFSERTGIAPDHVRFCSTRDGKAPICTELGITHFVDDRLEVLGYLTTVPHRYLFHPNPQEIARFRQHRSLVSVVDSWATLLPRLLVS